MAHGLSVLIDKESQRELKACVTARHTKQWGWTYRGVNGLIGTPSALLVAALTRIARSHPPIGSILAQCAGSRLQSGQDPQTIAQDLLSMVNGE